MYWLQFKQIAEAQLENKSEFNNYRAKELFAS